VLHHSFTFQIITESIPRRLDFVSVFDSIGYLVSGVSNVLMPHRITMMLARTIFDPKNCDTMAKQAKVPCSSSMIERVLATVNSIKALYLWPRAANDLYKAKNSNHM
jgi:hypothetical protein